MFFFFWVRPRRRIKSTASLCKTTTVGKKRRTVARANLTSDRERCGGSQRSVCNQASKSIERRHSRVLSMDGNSGIFDQTLDLVVCSGRKIRSVTIQIKGGKRSAPLGRTPRPRPRSRPQSSSGSPAGVPPPTISRSLSRDSYPPNSVWALLDLRWAPHMQHRNGVIARDQAAAPTKHHPDQPQ